MKNEITGTDIKMIAKGYWDRQFYWRIYPRSKPWWIIALITFALGIGLMVFEFASLPNVSANMTGGASMPSLPTPTGIAATILIITAFVTFLLGIREYQSDKDDFVNETVCKWETGDKRIPDTDDVLHFVQHEIPMP